LQRGDQMILHAAGEGIYGVNAKGETTFLNPAAERMLGWRCEDLIGRTIHSVIHHSHEDGSHYHIKACPIYAAFRGGKIHRVLDEVFWRRDGTCFPVEYTSTPIQENGRHSARWWCSATYPSSGRRRPTCGRHSPRWRAWSAAWKPRTPISRTSCAAMQPYRAGR
jgi:PAS domain S-box-containing protein